MKQTCFVVGSRQECKKLREELKEEHEADKELALAQLTQSRELEFSNARESWQRKVDDLLEQVGLRTTNICKVGTTNDIERV